MTGPTPPPPVITAHVEPTDRDRVVRHVAHRMGLPVSVALRGRYAATDLGVAAWRAVLAELDEVDRTFSTYRPDSVVSRLDRGELTPGQCPPDVREVLDLGRDAEARSGGAFSVRLPGPDSRPHLNPSGVVKGWAVQRAARHLTALPDTDSCLSAGGDMTCHVADPSRPPWRVGIEDPREPARVLAVVGVRRGAVATSGTAHRGSHLFDARTGRPPTGVTQVSVIGPWLTDADIDATAAYALGADAVDWLRTRAGQHALVVHPDGTTTTVSG